MLLFSFFFGIIKLYWKNNRNRSYAAEFILLQVRKMKRIGKFKVNISAVIFAAAIITAVAAVYIFLLNRTVSDNINGTIVELAEHDQESIQTYIEDTWSELYFIAKKFEIFSCRTIVDAESLMNLESAGSRFSHIYLVSESGIVYTDKLLSYDPKNEGQNGRIDLLPLFDNDNECIVSRFDDKISAIGITKESILYGIRLNNFSIDGVKMVGLVGICDISTIQNRLNISSFSNGKKNRGYSSVIDMNGNFIVNDSKTVYLNQTDNFFTRIENSKKSDLTGEEITEKMKNNETFSFSHVTSDGVEQIIYCRPFVESSVPWYFMLSVEKGVFSEQNRTFLTMSMAMLVCILFVVVVLLIYVMASKSKVKEANAEVSARSRFLANMSHEIRTPLNGIIGLIYLIEQDIENGNDTDTIKLRLAKADSTANYLLSLINNILDISKIQSGKVILNNDAISPEIIMDAIWSMQKSNTESRGIDFEIIKDISVPWIIGDDISIKRVLMNIVGNAAKFTPSGGKITLSVSQKKESGNTVTTIFTCADTGCGMSKEFLNHIWDSFTQERRAGDLNQGGTGLGMAISKLLVTAMGGEIEVESTLGEGSVFTVFLHSDIAENPPVPSEQSLDNTASDKRLKILLAEDNELNSEILIEILESNDFDVVHAENGQVAVDIFRESEVGEFDVILMDMQMPLKDGCTAAAEIRSMNRSDAKTVTIFACTANTFKEDRDRALESGMNDFLSKPIDVNKMIEKIGGGSHHK
jgi:signal transduction histidine kinase/CheY-like chemotaxis protein